MRILDILRPLVLLLASPAAAARVAAAGALMFATGANPTLTHTLAPTLTL